MDKRALRARRGRSASGCQRARALGRGGGLGLAAQGGVTIGLSIMAGYKLKGIMVTDDLSVGDMVNVNDWDDPAEVKAITESFVLIAKYQPT